MNDGLLSATLNVFIAAFSGGFDRLRPAIGGLLHVLISLDLLFFGIMVLFGLDAVQNGLRKLLVLSLWAYAATHFDEIATSLVDSLVQAGMTAAGRSDISPRAVMNPSRIFDGFFQATQPIADQALKVKWYAITGTHVMFGFTLFMMVFAYFMLALSAFVAVIEYYMALSIAGVLLPFGVLAPTRWIAMKPLSYFLSCGIKLAVIAFLAAVSRDVLATIRFTSAEPTFKEMSIAVCTAGILAMLAWLAPQRLASGIMSGAASFGAGDVARHAAGTYQAAAAVTSPLRGKAAQSVYKAAGKGLVAAGAAGVGAAYGAARSMFKGAGARASSPPSPAAGAGIVPASPFVTSAVTNGSTGRTRGPVYEGEFSAHAGASRGSVYEGAAPGARQLPATSGPGGKA